MDTFKPFSFTMHVFKPIGINAQRCQFCKEFISVQSLAIASSGCDSLPWMFSCAHLDCFKAVVEQTFQPVVNEEVHVTSKLTRSGGKVDVSIGRNTFIFNLENAFNLAIGVYLSAIATTFDAWVYEVANRDGFDAIPMLVGIRRRRGEKTITNMAVLENPSNLFADCWNMFKLSCIEDVGIFPSSDILRTWRQEFETRFVEGSTKLQ